MPLYAVGYILPGGLGFDIGEFDEFSEAMAAAKDAGAAVPHGIVDAAQIIMQAGDSKTDIIWIQRFERQRPEG